MVEWHDENIAVHRLWTPAPGQNQPHPLFALVATLAGCVAKRPDVIWVSSPVNTGGVAAALISRLRGGIPLVIDVRDRIGYGQGERWAYQKATAMVVPSPGLGAKLRAEVPSEKIVVIPPFIDTDLVAPRARRNALSQANHWNDRFVVLLTPSAGLNANVFDAAAALQGDYPDILFALAVGDGTSEALRNEVRARRLGNVQVVLRPSHEGVPDLFSGADVGLIEHSSEDVMAPDLLTLWGVARPVIAVANASSETARVVRASSGGLCASPGDAPALAGALLALRQDPGRAERMGRSGRRWVEANGSRAHVATRYEALFAHLVAPGTNEVHAGDAARKHRAA